MNIKTEAEMIVIDRVRLLTGLSEDEVTDELRMPAQGSSSPVLLPAVSKEAGRKG